MRVNERVQKSCIENYENFVKGPDFGVCGVDLLMGTCYYGVTTPMRGIAILYHIKEKLSCCTFRVKRAKAW